MRVKRGTTRARERRRFLKQTKGYRWGRKNRIELAKTAVLKAGANAFRDRRRKKRTWRQLWQIQVNGAARQHGLSYSRFLALLKKQQIALNRKMLSELAQNEPAVFRALLDKVKSPR